MIMVIAMMAAVCFADTYKFPGWKCTDVAEFDKQIALQTNFGIIARDTALKALASNKYASFDQFKQIIEQSIDSTFANSKYAEHVKKLGDRAESEKAKWKVTFVKQFALCRREFFSEATAFTKKNPTNYDIYYLMNVNCPYTDKERYDGMVAFLLNSKYFLAPAMVKKSVDKIIDIGITADIDAAVLKQNLQKLNRKYSQKLITDKKNYEAIVAAIRTALETF